MWLSILAPVLVFATKHHLIDTYSEAKEPQKISPFDDMPLLNITGGPYGPKPTLSEEAKRLRSERIKEYHRKIGKGTAMDNSRARRGGKRK